MSTHPYHNSLSKALFDDVITSMDQSSRRWSRKLLEPLLWFASTRFARLATRIDAEIANSGLQQGLHKLLPKFISGYQATGIENVPPEGPLLVVSNHPGTVDSLLIAASLPRDDLKIFATGFSFLKQLPAARQHLIFSSNEISDRMLALRKSIRHLQQGATLLIFPSGKIDPDPAVLPGAEHALGSWSPSLELLINKVPDTQVLVTIVSGVLSQRWLNSAVMRIWKDRFSRLNMLGVSQVIRQLVIPVGLQVNPRISFATPLIWEQIQHYAVINFLDEIIARAKQLLSTLNQEMETE